MKQSYVDLGPYTPPFMSVFEDALPTMFMQKLIDKFEANEGNHQQVTQGTEGLARRFTEINISQHWQDEHDMFVTYVQEAWKTYMLAQAIQFDVQFPRQFGYEHFRMKRYQPNGTDEFGLHTDVGSYGTARRFVAFLWYLNTPEGGGATIFHSFQQRACLLLPAVAGRLLIFPPLWTHPHQGTKVTSGNKYIVSGYLHYI
jgi:hypothetical protein